MAHHQHGHDGHAHGGAPDPIKLAVGITIGAIALVIGIILMVKLAVGSYGARDLSNDPSMKPEAVKQRIAPVAKVAVDPNAPAPAVVAPAAAAAPVAAPVIPPPAQGGSQQTAAAAGAGKSTYDTACAACHGTGAAGAPKLGDKAAWAPRLAQGKDALHASAIKGKGAMPPKGGNAALSDDAVKAAVDFMTASVK